MKSTGKTSGRQIAISFGRNREVYMAYGILIIVLVMFATNQTDFFTPYGSQSIFNQVVTLAVAALAQTLVVLAAGIDLSIGTLISLTNSVAASMFLPLTTVTGHQSLGILLTVLLSLGIGAAGGLMNGLIIVYGRLQPIIATLATASIFGGIALYVRPTPGGTVPTWYATVLTGNLLTYIPVSALVVAVFIVLVWIPIRRSRFGQSVYAIGGNEYSAFVSGIQISRTKIWVYTLAGLLAGCAGLLFTAQTASGDPLGGASFTLNSIAAVVLGGTSLSGGRGGYIGSVAGAAILSLILGLLIFWGVSSFFQDAVQGLILIFALVVGLLQRSKKKLRTSPAG